MAKPCDGLATLNVTDRLLIEDGWTLMEKMLFVCERISSRNTVSAFVVSRLKMIHDA